MNLSRVRLSVSLLILLLAATSLFAADGKITGRVTRDNGSPIGGVIVQAIGTNRATITDQNGNFTLAVPPGTYTLNFSAGEHSATQEGVVVTDNAIVTSTASATRAVSALSAPCATAYAR